jgi:radical SAM superfamily enzyme YgiQ (UPF0313 family)
VNPWIVDFAAYDFWIKPLGLLLIGSHLRKQGFRVTLLDCLDRFHPLIKEKFPQFKTPRRFFGTGPYLKEILPKPDSIRHIPRRFGRYGLPLDCVREFLSRIPCPDIILVTSGMTYWYPGVFEMISLCRKYFPDVPVLLGGIYATLDREHAVRYSGADYVLSGQVLEEALNLVNKLTGQAIRVGESGPVWPAYDLYAAPESAAIRTSLGCPYRCPFCASHLLNPEMSRRDPEDVIKEIKAMARLGIRDVAFYDDALLIDRQRYIVPILKELSKASVPVRLHTPNGLFPRWIDEELAGLIYQSGFKTLRLSYESIQPERQKTMGKVNDTDLKAAVACLKKAGFSGAEIGSYVIMGLPGQKIGEVIDSLLFVLDQQIRVSLASYSPVPGTETWKEAVGRGLLSAQADPLLLNNSIFPLVNDPVARRKWMRLGTWVSRANQMIIKGESHAYKTWKDEVRRLRD